MAAPPDPAPPPNPYPVVPHSQDPVHPPSSSSDPILGNPSPDPLSPLSAGGRPPSTSDLPPLLPQPPLASISVPPDLTAIPSSSISLPPPPLPPLAAALHLRPSDPPAIPTSSSYQFPPPLFYSAAAPPTPLPSDQFPPLSSQLRPPPPATQPLSVAQANISSVSPYPPPAPSQPSNSIGPVPPLPTPLLPTPSPAAPTPGHGPDPPKSYAQASRPSKGPGFVRSHAYDVESFARLPRTGVNIICGSKEGIPSFSFVNSDLPAVENLYSNALIMKFHGGRPSLEASHREIQSWGIERPFSIGPLTSRAFLLRFQDQKDLIRVLSRPSSTIISFPYKVFRWHNLCHQLEDSCFAPVWISLPRLPLQCFVPEFLESVANKIGRYLCCDIATSTLARPSAARLCVELDLRIPPPPYIWVGLFEGYKQPVIYEKLPKFCTPCLTQGHTAVECPIGQREAASKQADPHQISIHGRTPPARQNVTRQSPSTSNNQSASSLVQQLNISKTTSSFPHTLSPDPPPSTTPTPSAPLHQSPPTATGVPHHQHSTRTDGQPTQNPVNNPQPVHISTTPSPPPPPLNPKAPVHPSSRQSAGRQRSHLQPSASQQASKSVAIPHPPPQSNPPTIASAAPSPSEALFQVQPAAATLQRTTATSTPAQALPQAQSAAALLQQQAPSSCHPPPGDTDPPDKNISNVQCPVSPSGHHPPNPPKTSRTSTLKKSNNQQRKSIALMPQQSNLEANQVFWNAVNYQLALNEQARLIASRVDASNSPIAICSSGVPSPPIPTIQGSSHSDDDCSSHSLSATDSQPNSPSTTRQDDQYPHDSLQQTSYDSEGEEPIIEHPSFQGYNTDDLMPKRSMQSKRNKRHPDQPLKVQLRARKTPNPKSLH